MEKNINNTCPKLDETEKCYYEILWPSYLSYTFLYRNHIISGKESSVEYNMISSVVLSSKVCKMDEDTKDFKIFHKIK